MLDDGEDIQYILLEEGRPVLILEIILAQQYLNSSLDAEAAQQRDLLQMEVLYCGV